MKTLPAYQMQKAAREMVNNFRKARSMAIKFHRPVVVAFYAANDQYAIDGRSPLDGKWLPQSAATAVSMPAYYGNGVKLGFPGRSTSFKFSDGGSTITFDTTGLTGGVTGYVYLQNRYSLNNKTGYRIGITSLAGNIRMDQCGSAGVNCNVDP